MKKVGGNDDMDERENVDKIREKKFLGRPVGSWDTKRTQDFDMMTYRKPMNQEGKRWAIYCDIKRCGDGKYLLNSWWFGRPWRLV